MDEITLRDLLAWDDRLRPVVLGPEPALGRPVSWAVAARAVAPALPALRGGEIVLLPEAVVAEQDSPIPAMLTDLARQGVAAAVLDGATGQAGLLPDVPPIPVLTLHGPLISVEVESELNRLLTERRGELYRVGTELGRLLSNMTANRSGLKQILDVTFEEIRTPIMVTDRTGTVLAAASGTPERDATARRVPRPADDHAVISQMIRGGGRVWLGPVAADRRARARVAAERLVVAIEAALVDANWFRPRGPERAGALKRFVMSASRLESSEARVQSVALGLDPNATFRVALSRSVDALREARRCHGPNALVHDLAKIGDYDAALIELKPEHVERAATDFRPAAKPGSLATGPTWVATSGPAAGVVGLSEASRQAIYIAGLLDAGLINRATVRFDRVAEIGGFRLLYPFWESTELASFAAEILGDLVSEDHTGVLRQTLLHFLESGGSRVEAAQRAAIHRNTLTYRLRRIRELTTLDPAEPADRLSLHLAVLALSMPGLPPDASH